MTKLEYPIYIKKVVRIFEKTNKTYLAIYIISEILTTYKPLNIGFPAVWSYKKSKSRGVAEFPYRKL